MAALSRTAAAEPQPLQGAALILTALALATGTFMQVLDTTIANVSIPTIAGDLGVTTSQGTWLITSFAVANGVSVPLTGWLMARFGPVKTFTVSVALFTLASFLCGIAWNLPSLIAFRLLQGGVSGPMIPGSYALLTTIFPRARTNVATAIWSMTTMAAPVAGPLLGGWISDNVSWSWIFLINVPVGLFCVLFTRRGLKGRDGPGRKLPVDGVGLGLLALWVGALQVMLDTGKDADWFASPAILVLTLVAVFGFAAWVIWETTDAQPMVDLTIFRSRNFAIGVAAFSLGYAALFSNILLMPLWMQTQLGYVATWAGLVLAPAGVLAVLMAPLGARFLGKVDTRITASVALGLFAVASFMRSLLPPDAAFISLVMPMLAQGVGMGVFFTSMITLSMTGIPPEKTAAASSLQNFARITAGGFAASLTTTLWERREALHQTRLAEVMGSHPGALDQTLAQIGRLGAGDGASAALVTRTAISQAYSMAAGDVFWLSAWIMLLIIPAIWLTRKALPNGQVIAAE